MNGTLTPARYLRVWGVWLLLAMGMFFLCMMVGPDSHHISWGWPGPGIETLRMSRVLAAGVVGLALAAAGVTLQALLRNPLADPYVLGISTGSSVGVMAWLLLAVWWKAGGMVQWVLEQGQMVPAAAGAVATCLAVFALARPRRGTGGGGGAMDPMTLLLIGVVVAAVNGAVLMVLNSLAPAGVKANFLSYVMGSISNDVTWRIFSVAACVVAAGWLPILISGRALNIGSLSDVEATSMGVHVGRLRTVCFLSASVMTGAAIMLSGPIGFVGLICPHICRGLVGADHRKLAVAAPLCGAAFLMGADTFVRATGGVFYGELPVGVVTALCGGPFFLLLLKRRGAV